MKGHTQQTQQRGLLFTIHHEFQVKTKFSHHFRHEMHVPGGTNVTRTSFRVRKGPANWRGALILLEGIYLLKVNVNIQNKVVFLLSLKYFKNFHFLMRLSKEKWLRE